MWHRNGKGSFGEFGAGSENGEDASAVTQLCLLWLIQTKIWVLQASSCLGLNGPKNFPEKLIDAKLTLVHFRCPSAIDCTLRSTSLSFTNFILANYLSTSNWHAVFVTKRSLLL